MKSFCRVIFYTAVSIICLLFVAELSLRFFMPMDSVSSSISVFVSSKTGADVEIGKINAGLFGITIKDLKLNYHGQTITSISQVYTRFNPFALLSGKIRVQTVIISGLTLNLNRYKDGTFNFDFLLNNIQPNTVKDTPPSVFDFFAQQVQIEKSTINFTDEQQKFNATLTDIFVNIFGFSFDKTFSISTKMVLNLSQGSRQLVHLPFGFTLYPNLAGLDLQKAYMDLRLFTAHLQNAVITIKGDAKNFDMPSILMDISARDVSAQLLANFMQIPDFKIPLVKVALKLLFDIKNSKINITQFNVHTLASDINATGAVILNNKPAYELKVLANLVLPNISSAIPLAQQFEPQGQISADMDITDKNISGIINLSDIGATLAQAGILTHLNAQVTINALDDIRIPALSGRLNKEAFNAKLSYSKNNINFAFNANTVNIIKSAQSAQQPMPAPNTASVAQSDMINSWPLPPLAVKGNLAIKHLNSPFFMGDNINLKADISGITPGLDKMRGTMLFTTDEGEIKDLYKLTNANAVTRVLFISLGIVSKVINTLNVMDLLNTLSDAVIGTNAATAEDSTLAAVDYDEQDVQQQTAPAPKKIDGKLDYDSFNTAIKFQDGKSDIGRLNFISSMLSFKVTGNINFNNRKLDMKVNAAPGKHNIDGIMPLTLDIGGTVEAPQGSMSMLASAASLITQSLFNNQASNAIKKGFMGLLGIAGPSKTEGAITDGPQPVVEQQPLPYQTLKIINDSIAGGHDATQATALPTQAGAGANVALPPSIAGGADASQTEKR